MQHYSDNVQDLQGNARVGVSVSVYSGASLATIYADNGNTVKANPMTSGAGGAFDFYAANGDYTISVSGATKSITLFDAAAAPTATPTSSSYVVGETAGVVRRFAVGVLGGYKTLAQYGTADYTGTPLYDGADSGRITATDNTTAFQSLVNAAIAAGSDSVRIPAGHWGIKTGNMSFSNFTKLRIFGDGIGVTILDFIKEDTTHTGGAYVDTADANVIATFTTGQSLEFQDMTVKATTKGGLVNGVAGSNRVYEGAVWAFSINNVADVRLTRVRAERFNYRGFSIYGTSTERVTMLHCEGFYNVGSGFWVQDAALFKVTGGEYAYNGVFGETGTGYGVTASSGVGKFLVDAPYCHHNYRKGIDSHGCSQFVVKRGTFENNVLFHLADPNWSPPTGIVDCAVTIKGNTFSNGKLPVDKTWLQTCYEQLATNGYTAASATGQVIAVYDVNSAGTVTDKMTSIVIEDNDVLCHYNGGSVAGMTSAAAPIGIIAPNAEILFKNNRFKFEYTTFPATGDVYSHILMQVNVKNTRWAGNEVRWIESGAYTNSTSTLADCVSVMSLLTSSAIPMALELYDNRFEFNDAYFITTTGSGVRAAVTWTATGSKRIAKNNTFSWLADPFDDSSSLNNSYFLGVEATTNAALEARNNTFIRAGVRYTMPEPRLNMTSSEMSYSLPSVSKLTGADVFYIVLDKQYGTTIKISTNDGSADLLITIPLSDYTGITGSAGNSQFEYSSVNASLSEDGLTKLKITVKAKADLSGDYWGRIKVNGTNASLGIERVVKI